MRFALVKIIHISRLTTSFLFLSFFGDIQWLKANDTGTMNKENMKEIERPKTIKFIPE